MRYVVENYGDSELAKRFGVTRYPAFFVDDVLAAKPKDFGFYGKGEGAENGRYAPWKQNPESYEKFRRDLTRMVELALAGKGSELRAERADDAPEALVPAKLPALTLTSFDGAPLTSEALGGKVTLVEFWATWCPPCRNTLEWLGTLEKRYGDRLEVVAVAIESDEPDVRKIAGDLALPLRWTMGTPELAQQFGDIAQVPTLFLFAADGTAREIFYGAPPTLHESVERELAALLGR
ncbi:MAG: TlpA family protein disulfide reductase [Myxococcota bacterium]